MIPGFYIPEVIYVIPIGREKELIMKSGSSYPHISSLITLMRPKHYIKNFLVFVSAVFSKNLLNLNVLIREVLGFACFCLLSSVVYIINDINDVEADRQHEVKRDRPIASGAVSIRAGWVFAAGLLFLALGINIMGGFSALSFALMGAYFAINLGYSLGLKNIPILDVVLLMLGFLLRVLYGAAIIDSSVSSWVYLTVITLSFYLGLGKRRNELKKNGDSGTTRHVLAFYTYEFLDKFMYLCLTLAIAFYALWSADVSIIEKFGTDALIWTVPLVIVLMMKYSADIEAGSYGDPVDVITHDKVLVLLTVLFCVVLLGLIYLPDCLR